MSTVSITELEKKKTNIRASRITLLVLLVIEAFILLMHFPGFLGMAWLENMLIGVRTFLVDILWPANSADMVTYRGTIYEIVTWFKELPAYPLLVKVIIYLVPGLFVLTFIRIRILDLRIKMINNPDMFRWPKKPRTPRKPKEPKPPKEPRANSGGVLQTWILESGLTPEEAAAADAYCKKHQERCDDPFSEEPGIRIQRLVGELPLGERRDFVKPWDANGEINLSAYLDRPVRVKLEHGKPYIYSKNNFNQEVRGNKPMKRFDPMGFVVAAEAGKPVICIITWLGG